MAFSEVIKKAITQAAIELAKAMVVAITEISEGSTGAGQASVAK